VPVTEDLLASRYRLDAPIGKGGLADVFAATDVETDEAVAVKVLRSVEVTDAQRFDLEARVLQALNHPGIVQLREVGSDGERSFLVLDLVRGPSLHGLLADGAIGCDAAIELCAHVADALAHAHSRGIIHRDIKPANILIDDADRPHLSDFGIARLVDTATTGITATGFVIGTAAYLAPEQVRGERVSAAADVYALGLVLLECCSGERAFAGSSIEAAMARLTKTPDLPDDMPTWCKPLLRAMTAQDPALRPSAVTVARALHDREYSGVEDWPTQPVDIVEPTTMEAEPTAVYEIVPVPADDLPVASPAPTATAAPDPRPVRRPASQRLPVPLIVALVVVIMLAAFAVSSMSRSPKADSGTKAPPTPELTTALKHLEDSVG
jgi:serine/threonine protein kinase